ncbi:RES domain-containing protein [Geodermatophilus obscurus]|uniref:RES domain-containing protein n=1 Tax=Geodermatophilus obscurus TaxID=1861 RepID=UPI002452BC17|nr:RES domain-containing protein [Geodermatophilus obscurus]
MGRDPLEPPRVWPGPGRYRFDDPQRSYAVRYVAARLRGALLETMEYLRPAPGALARLAAVVDGEPRLGEADTDHAGGVVAWLAAQQVARLVVYPAGPVLSVNDPALLTALDDDPGVIAAIAEAGPGEPGARAPRLDQGLVRASGPAGRRITQALGRAVFTVLPTVAGLAYRSRLDDDELCWALRAEVPVIPLEVRPLSPTDPDHRSAVQAAAVTLGIDLTTDWR